MSNFTLESAPSPQPASAEMRWAEYKRRLFLAVGLVAFLIVLASFIGETVSVLLLVFLCILIAIGLRSLSTWVAQHTPLSPSLALALTVFLIAALIVGLLVLMGSRLAGEFSALGSTLQESLSRLEEQLRQYTWGEQILQQMPNATQLSQQLLGNAPDFFSRVTGVFSSVLGLLSSAILVLFISLFLAAQPAVYRDNFLRLLPKSRRSRVRQTLLLIGDTLRKWLLTRFISIGVIGALTITGLLLLNVSLAVSLGIVAALAGIIPTFGPILALIPAVLVALIAGPQQVLFVFLLYIGIQMVDNYLVTPLVQKEMLYLPPAYIIVSQLLFGVVAGSFGLVLAAPLAAALVIFVRMLYVEDVLGDTVESESS